MNSIVNFDNAPDLGGFGAADFDTVSIPTMIDFNGRSIATGKHAIVRTDTSEVLGHHGSRHQKVCQKEAITTTEKMFFESDLKTNTMTREISCSHNGSNTFARYTFPDHQFKSPDGDTSTLTALLTTSFNSTFPFMIAFGENLRACNNNNIWLTGVITMFKARHTKGLNISNGAKAVGNVYSEAQKNHELFWDMYYTPVNSDVAFDTYAAASGVTNQVNEVKREIGSTDWRSIINKLPRQNQNLNYMVQKSKDYENRMGKNKWAVYNTLTDWSTHANPTTERSKQNIAAIKVQRAAKVRDAVNSVLLAA